MSFVRIFVDSFVLLKKCPRLFIPKILVSFLILPMIVITTAYVIDFNFLTRETILAMPPSEVMSLLVQLVFLLVYGLIIYIVDYFLVNPLYPVVVKQYYQKKKVNFRKAFLTMLKHFGVIFPMVALFTFLFFGIMGPMVWLTSNFIASGNMLMTYISIGLLIIVFFVILILFYLLYPISSIENLNLGESLRQTIKKSLKHKGEVIKALLISIFVSGLSYLFSGGMIITGSEGNIWITLFFFLLLLITRVLVAIFVTYQYVLNTVFYLGFEKGIFLGE